VKTLLAAALAIVLAWPSSGAALVGTPVPWDSSWPMSAAILDEAIDLPDTMSDYDMEVTLDPERGVLSGSIAVTFINHSGGAIDGVPFRLFPNAEYYGEASTTVEHLFVDGRPEEGELSVLDTVFMAPLDQPLEPDNAVSIAFDFETIVPADSAGSFGIFSHDLERETWVLSDWYPVLAGWDVETGWGLEPPTIWGDPTFTDTATYELLLTVPTGMSVASTGSETVISTRDALDTYQIVTGPARDLSLVIDNDFKTNTREAGDVAINLFLDAGTPDSGSDQLLGLTAAVLADYSGRYGPYPYDELDIVQTELAGALGVSWSGVIFMDAATVQQSLASAGDPAGILAFTLAHEIAHQWWGGKVGVNSNDHAYMNESLSSYLTVVVWETIFGPDVARQALVQIVAAPYLRFLEANPDGIVDRPVGEVGSANEFGRLVYGKGGLGFHAIRRQIGDAAFFAGLENYANSQAFRIADPADLREAFENASGQELGSLWAFWFDSAETTAADVQALLAG